jgi:hypothetical protein
MSHDNWKRNCVASSPNVQISRATSRACSQGLGWVSGVRSFLVKRKGSFYEDTFVKPRSAFFCSETPRSAPRGRRTPRRQGLRCPLTCRRPLRLRPCSLTSLYFPLPPPLTQAGGGGRGKYRLPPKPCRILCACLPCLRFALAASLGVEITLNHLLSVPACCRPVTLYCIRPKATVEAWSEAHPRFTETCRIGDQGDGVGTHHPMQRGVPCH